MTNEQAIMGAAQVFAKNSREFRALTERWGAKHPRLHKTGLRNIELLKKAHRFGHLEKVLGTYTDQEDLMKDWAKPGWYTTLILNGDCDDSVWLVAEIFPVEIYCQVQAKNGKLINPARWHFFCRDEDGGIWNNFGYEGIMTPWKFTRKSYKECTHLVRCDKEFNVGPGDILEK